MKFIVSGGEHGVPAKLLFRGVFFLLTTVYPTDTSGAHGNSGDKSAGKDVFGSGKGRKWLETSNRYSGILWDQDAAGSNPVISTISSVHN